MTDISIETLIACGIITFASAVQTAIGFGLALIAVPMLLLINPDMVPAPILLVAFVQLSLNSWAHRKHIDWQPLVYAFIGRIPGTLLAVWALMATGLAGIQVFIGIAVLMAVAMSIGNWKIEASNTNHFWAGSVAGFTGTTTAIGGPPIALLYQHEQGDKVRANLSVFFVFGSAMSFAGMAWAGAVTQQSFYFAALFIPAAIVGFWLGIKSKHWLQPRFMRPAILILCGSSGLTVLWQALITLEIGL